MTTIDRPPRRRGEVLAILAVFGLSVGVVAVLVEVFEFGVLAGLGLAGCGIVACSVSAPLLGLPFPSLGDLVAFLIGLTRAVADNVLWAVLAFLCSLCE